MSACCLALADGREGGRQIDAECCLGTDERRVKPVECVSEDGSGFGIAEAGQRMPTPAGKMHGVKCDVRPLVGWGVWQQLRRLVEGVQACDPVAVGGEGFSMRGGKPCPED